MLLIITCYWHVACHSWRRDLVPRKFLTWIKEQTQAAANNICLVIGRKNNSRFQNQILKTFYDERSVFIWSGDLKRPIRNLEISKNSKFYQDFIKMSRKFWFSLQFAAFGVSRNPLSRNALNINRSSVWANSARAVP